MLLYFTNNPLTNHKIYLVRRRSYYYAAPYRGSLVKPLCSHVGYHLCKCAASRERRSDGVSAFNEPDGSNLLFTFHHTCTGWHTMDIAWDFLYLLVDPDTLYCGFSHYCWPYNILWGLSLELQLMVGI